MLKPCLILLSPYDYVLYHSNFDSQPKQVYIHSNSVFFCGLTWGSVEMNKK